MAISTKRTSITFIPEDVALLDRYTKMCRYNRVALSRLIVCLMYCCEKTLVKNLPLKKPFIVNGNEITYQPKHPKEGEYHAGKPVKKHYIQ